MKTSAVEKSLSQFPQNIKNNKVADKPIPPKNDGQINNPSKNEGGNATRNAAIATGILAIAGMLGWAAKKNCFGARVKGIADDFVNEAKELWAKIFRSEKPKTPESLEQPKLPEAPKTPEPTASAADTRAAGAQAPEPPITTPKTPELPEQPKLPDPPKVEQKLEAPKTPEPTASAADTRAAGAQAPEPPITTPKTPELPEQPKLPETPKTPEPPKAAESKTNVPESKPEAPKQNGEPAAENIASQVGNDIKKLEEEWEKFIKPYGEDPKLLQAFEDLQRSPKMKERFVPKHYPTEEAYNQSAPFLARHDMEMYLSVGIISAFKWAVAEGNNITSYAYKGFKGEKETTINILEKFAKTQGYKIEPREEFCFDACAGFGYEIIKL